MKNHYKYLDNFLVAFLKKVFAEKFNQYAHNDGLIVAHGDKCYQYRNEWEAAGIPFNHGVMIYLLSYLNPYADTVRQTANGWIPVETWVIERYPEFKEIIFSLELALDN